tara:strand:- start:1912 stop:2019 length:108 start_codon:yes stop_codon:yes gene_type:complete
MNIAEELMGRKATIFGDMAGVIGTVCKGFWNDVQV